ncbi:MAG: response regulator [Bacilli bacterium]|nr:response regulator [Bacilli bacterium]
MKTGLVLTIGSLGFMVLLMISYYLQQQQKSVGNKLYRILLNSVIIILITEIGSSYCILSLNWRIVGYLILRLSWFVGIIWFWMFYLYSICFLRDIKVNKVRELIKTDTRCKIISIFTGVCLIVYLFLPFTDMNYETYTYLAGWPTYFTIIYASIISMLTIILMIKRRNEINARHRMAVLLILAESVVFIVLQIMFPRTMLFGLAFGLGMYFLYFYIENPDLMMINSLEELKKEVERSSLAKSDFLSNMSHEIRSPMNAIVGFSETILNNPEYDPESIRTDIEHIATSGNNLLDIINNILDISKIESGNETIEEKEYSIGNIVLELSSIIEARLANRPVEFITEVDRQIPKKVYGDSTKVFQVLLNVLTNSMKYTEVGKIKLVVAKEMKSNTVILKFKITDTGYGIKPEDYDKLFEKFSRLTSATTNEIEGTGLGLVITKKYVDLLGGKIWFESDYGVGTTFYIEIAQRIVDATPIGDIREANDKDEKIDYLDCSGKKVLVVDDNDLNLKVTKRILSEYKFTVETITSGRDCVYKIKAGQQYDIIFLDHMMPDLDGIEVVHILKKLPDYKIPPVVALTANAITGVRDMYLREGFDEYLSKPINRSELNQIINKYFKNKE